MALTDPQIYSMQNSARLVRGVYCSGMAESFAVWLSDLQQGTYFIARSNSETYGSEFMIINVTEYILSFSVVEGLVPNEVIFFYATRDYLKYFIFNFETQTLVLAPTFLTYGNAPSVNKAYSLPLYVYERERELKIRAGAGIEYAILSTASHFIREIATTQKNGLYIFNYLGAHSPNVDIALPIRVNVNSNFLFDCTETPVSNQYSDKSPNGHVLLVGDNQAIPDVGLLFPNENLTSTIASVQPSNSQLTLEAKFKPHLNSNESYLLKSSEMNFRYNQKGLVYWDFIADGQTHYYIHERILGLRPDEINYIGIRHIFGNKSSTDIVINGIAINGRWYSTIPAQSAGSGAITAFANLGGGIVRVTSNGHGMSNDTWVRIYGTVNYNNLFKISNVFANTFDITAVWAGDDATGTWDKKNDFQDMAGYGLPNFSNLTYYCSLGSNDILAQIGLSDAAKTVNSLIEIAKGRA